MQKGLDTSGALTVCDTSMGKPRTPKPTPAVKPDQRRNVWLSQAQLQKIIELAEREDRSFSAMIRRLVQEGLETYERRWRP